jgi:hypothetical protein
VNPDAASTDRPTAAFDSRVVEAFKTIPELLSCDEKLISRGRLLDVECLLGPTVQPFHVTISGGRIVDMSPAPVLMRSWRFAYRATPAAYGAYWQAMPPPGWHDLLALTKRGEATLEGDLHPFMSHLQYYKDLLALPRRSGFVGAP